MLSIVEHGEVDVEPAPHSGALGRVRYSLRTTNGIGFAFALAIAADVGVRWLSAGPTPPFAISTVLAVVWGVRYLIARVRVPLLLKRAADD